MATLTREERETILRTDDAGDEWTIYTCSPVMKRQLDRIAEAWGVRPRQVDKWGWEYRLPTGALAFRKPRRLTAAQREATAARLTAARRRARVG